MNDKTTSQESANEFLVGKLGVPLSIYETMFGTDYFAELSKKDLTALLLSMLQVQIDYKKLSKLQKAAWIHCRKLSRST